MLKIYQQGKQSTASPGNMTSVLIGTANLNLPIKISNKNYEIDLVPMNPLFVTIANITSAGTNVTYAVQTGGAKIVVKSLDDPKITITKDVPNIDASIQGTLVDGQNATLQYYRYNFNGTVYDKIILGQQPIIIDISTAS